jgi:DNA-binding HxlR family transcriptional regulator
MGEALADPLARMARWESDWTVRSDPSERRAPKDRCTACGAAASARDIDLELSEAQLRKMPAKQAAHRRSTISGASSASATGLGESLDIFGDKWGIEILICAFFRVRRFSDFRTRAGIAPNILSDRLTRLIAAGVLAPSRAGEADPGYWLTEKGIDLYGVVVSIQDWADAWLPTRYRSPVRLIHRGCGAVFHPMEMKGAAAQ